MVNDRKKNVFCIGYDKIIIEEQLIFNFLMVWKG